MQARGQTLGRLLDDERWSNRQAGARLGLSHRYVGDRLNGKVDITFSDIEAFAQLLKMEPNELFLKLLGLDSNQEPIGFQSAINTHGKIIRPEFGGTRGLNKKTLAPVLKFRRA